YKNRVSTDGSVVAAEVDLVNKNLTGSETQKESVMPVLREGTPATALPPLLGGRVYADFRHEEMYFAALFDLVLSMYRVPFDDEDVTGLRTSLLPLSVPEL